MIALKRFTPDEFDEYARWFDDPVLMEHLGPRVTRDWLQFILTDQTGIQYAAFAGDDLVAVAGITLPDKEHRQFVITDLAVHPEKRGQQLGSRVVTLLMHEHAEHEVRRWLAYVDEKNGGAKSFFESIGWTLQSAVPDADDMFVFQAPDTAPDRGQEY